MKKLISVVLVVCTCLAAGAMLTACGHEHEASTAWMTDESYHWKECAASGCDEVLEKAEHLYEVKEGDKTRHQKVCECGKTFWLEHNFDEGVVEVEPSKGVVGRTVYTCGDCGFKKNENVQYQPKTTVNAGDFKKLINLEGVTNYSVKIDGDYELAKYQKGKYYEFKDAAVKEDNKWFWSMENGTKYQYYRQNNAYWVKVTSADAETRYDWRQQLVGDLVYFFDFSSFRYDEEGKYYETVNEKASMFCDIAGEEGKYVYTYDKIQLYFEDDQLVKIQFIKGDYSMYARIEYGKVDFTLPEVQ